VENWREYEVALRDRGSLTVWVTPEAIAAWHPARTGRPGRSAHYRTSTEEADWAGALCLSGIE